MTIYLAKGRHSQTLYPFTYSVPDSSFYDVVKIEVSPEELQAMHEVINRYDALQLRLNDLFKQAKQAKP